MTYAINNLWANLELHDTKEKTAKILAKMNKPKKVKEMTDEQLLKSNKTSLADKLAIIEKNVMQELGHRKDETICIWTKEALHNYINVAIANKVISIDTETNNSTDPLTCKLMGPCLYTPGQKSVYIPVNHVNPETEELLPNQLTEEELKKEFDRLVGKADIIMHNGKFDYKVISCTCHSKLAPQWDTMIAAKLLNENEPARLKWQFKDKVDPDAAVYNIETFFKYVKYAYVDPEVFKLYAATDAYDTYKLYEYQKKQFEMAGNENLYNLFLNIEMPVVEVTSEMELYGVKFDKELSDRLFVKWNTKREKNTIAVEAEMEKYKPLIDKWRVSKKATEKTPKKDKNTGEIKLNKNGEPLYNKSKAEQLSDPIELSSPAQVAILLYDILGVKVVDPEQPRGTGDEILKNIDLPLAKLLLEKRGIDKLLDSFIVPLPELVKEDGRIHASFNQLGTDEKNVVTGRFSSKEPNLQQVPSRGPGASIRMLFSASCHYQEVEAINKSCVITLTDEVQLSDESYVWAKDLTHGMVLSDGSVVDSIIVDSNNVRITLL